MKQTEKNRKSREYILTHAFAEFAEHGYAGSSLNLICTAGNISKGLLYHYYPSKDALYLVCVEKLFKEMTVYLHTQLDLSTVTPESYFAARMQFFQQCPQHHRLFFDVITYPPTHLSAALQDRRAAFDRFNDSAVRAVLRSKPLASGLTLEDAVRQFRMFADFLGAYLRDSSPNETERQASALLHTLMYGLITR